MHKRVWLKGACMYVYYGYESVNYVIGVMLTVILLLFCVWGGGGYSASSYMYIYTDIHLYDSYSC